MRIQNIIVSVLVTAFLALNTYLVFAEKSVIPKAQYVGEYERLTRVTTRKSSTKKGSFRLKTCIQST